MRRPHLAAAVVYAAVTAYFFFGIVREPTTKVSFLWGDGFALLWDFWWAHRAVTAVQSPFRTNLLSWAHDASLVFHPLDLFDGILTIPFQNLFPGTSGLVLGLNVIGVGCFLVSALVMYAALWWLCRSWLPALVGGFAYSFCAFHMLRIENPILGAMYWLPLYAVLYLRAAEGRSRGRWALAGLCLGLSPFQSLYYAMFLCLLTPFLLAAALLRAEEGRRALPRLLLMTVAIGAFMLPMAGLAAWDLSHTEYLAEGAADATAKVLGDDVRNSIDLAGLVLPGPAQGLWGPHAWKWNWYLRRPTIKFMFGQENGAGGLLAYVGVVPILLFIVGLVRGPRRVVLLWGACAAVFLGLALGPHLHVHGWVYRSPWLPLPYRLILLGPTSLTKMFRAPDYFLAPALFAFWVVAAFGLRSLLRGAGARPTMAVLAVWLVLDYARPPMPVYDVAVPEVYEKIAADTRLVKVLQLPLFDFFALEYYSFLQTVHEKPLVRGFIGRRDPWIARRDRQIRELFDSGHLDVLLSRLGPTYIVVHKEEWLHYAPWNTVLAQLLGTLGSLVMLHDDDHVTVYSLALEKGPQW